MKLVKYVLQYIFGILDLGFKFDREANILDKMAGYIDSEFLRSKIDRKSTRGYIFMVVGAAINHLSKL